MRRRLITLALSLALIAALSACAGSKNKGPDVSPASGSVSSAVHFAGGLESDNARFEEASGQAETVTTSLEGFPEGISGKKVDWKAVAAIYEQANADGQNAAVAEQLRTGQAVKAFMEAHSDAMSRNVTSAVNSGIKKEGCACEPNLWGSVKYGLNQGVEDAGTEGVRDYSEAHRMIEAEEGNLGRRGTKTLQEQADSLIYGSYVVHVEMVELRNELKDKVAAADDASSTLQDAIEDQEAIVKSENADKGDKKVAQERIEEFKAAQAPIAESKKKAEALLKKAEKDVKAMQDKWDEAVEGLVKKTEAKAEGEATAKSGF